MVVACIYDFILNPWTDILGVAFKRQDVRLKDVIIFSAISEQSAKIPIIILIQSRSCYSTLEHLPVYLTSFLQKSKHILVREGLLHIYAWQSRGVAEAKLLVFSLSLYHNSTLIAINVLHVACQRPGLFPYNPQTWKSLESVIPQSAIVGSPKTPDKSQSQARPRPLEKWSRLERTERSGLDVIGDWPNF